MKSFSDWRVVALCLLLPLAWTAPAHAHRQYDPGKRRFLQRDPIRFVDGPNLYAYQSENPPRYLDNSGRRIAVPDPTDHEHVIADLNTLCPDCHFFMNPYTGEVDLTSTPGNLDDLQQSLVDDVSDTNKLIKIDYDLSKDPVTRQDKDITYGKPQCGVTGSGDSAPPNCSPPGSYVRVTPELELAHELAHTHRKEKPGSNYAVCVENRWRGKLSSPGNNYGQRDGKDHSAVCPQKCTPLAR